MWWTGSTYFETMYRRKTVSRSEQAEAIRGILNRQAVIERGMCLVTRSWYMSWKTFVDTVRIMILKLMSCIWSVDNLPTAIEEEEEEEKEEEEEEKMSSFVPLRPRLVRKDFVVHPKLGRCFGNGTD